jgi:glutamate-ammonia-ligase adenylyltransferase
MAEQATDTSSLASRIAEWPLVASEDSGTAAASVQQFIDEAGDGAELAALRALVGQQPVRNLLAGIFAGSPYLSGLCRRDASRLQRFLTTAPEDEFSDLRRTLERDLDAAVTLPEAARALRIFKTDVALLTALADLGGVWPVMKVTEVLTATADAALQGAVRFLFRDAVRRGAWQAPPDGSSVDDTGYIVLAMGKYGANELNYSSDIDLIVFYDLEKARVAPGAEVQPFFVRITRDLVRLMDERTGDGYVFRTDLRLRPDSGATQIALSTDAALEYYESFGQNWERAALIKARPCAGDIEAGKELLRQLGPYIWRKYLDYAAIADVHAMKRQIHAFRGFGAIGVAGHNIKLGRGGIREIEFFAQTQQLIAGGRQSDLRVGATLEALRRLTERGWINEAIRADLDAAYLFLRRIEHRLQMVADDQTHELPEQPDDLKRFAAFAGFPDVETFSTELVARLETVQSHYGALFEDVPELTAGQGNMVFSGEQDDPGTLRALAAMGYENPSRVLATVRGWHHGRAKAIHSERARERLTEVQPMLIASFAATADPDRALAIFDDFISDLPAGVQLFSLLRANPKLMRLVADIMGTAPRLARILARRRRLMEAVLDPRTSGELPTTEELRANIAAEIGAYGGGPIEGLVQYALDRARVIGNEQAFLIGVRVLSGTINANQAGEAYARLAEQLIDALKRVVEEELVRSHGAVPGGAAVVVAMGKLGGREMTASSDLDLMLVYEYAADAAQTDGAKALAPTQFYSRLTQRLIAALSAPTAEGALYEVDMRLRPSGQKGPLATQLSSFVDYQAHDAWTWEHLALTRARVICGPPELEAKVQDAIRAVLLRRRDRAKIAADVRDMRQRIAAEKGTTKIWDLKQVRGGLVDLEFIAQYLQLIHAADNPSVLDQNTLAAYEKLKRAGLLATDKADVLIRATRLVHGLTQILRLCLDGPFEPETAPPGLKDLLAQAADAPDFANLEARLSETLQQGAALFDELIV